MKRILLITLLLIGAKCWSQQVPLYTNYDFNLLTLNPAVAGSQTCLDLRTGHRRQWVGIDGAPVSTYATANGSFGKRKDNFHGIGVLFEQDGMKRIQGNSNVGPIGYFSMQMAYALHLKVNRKNMLSLGGSLGFSKHTLALSGLEVADKGDPSIASANSSGEFLFPLISVGLWYQSKTRYMGLSARNVVERNFQNVANSSFRRHYYLIMGKSIRVDDKLFFKPSVNLRYVSGSPVAADVNLVFDFNDLFEFGASFRGGHGISGMVKVGVLKYLTIGYAYDRTFNKLRFGGPNSHEVILGIQACPRGPKRGIKCFAYD